MGVNLCTVTNRRQMRKQACGPPCCEPIHCHVETKACHATQWKNGFPQNMADERGRPLLGPNEPPKYYLRSQKTVTFNQSCKSPTSWGCFRGLAIFRCRFGQRSSNSDSLSAGHTIWKSDGGRTGCEDGSVSGSGNSRSSGSIQNITGGGQIYGYPCNGGKSYQGGESSSGQTQKSFFSRDGFGWMREQSSSRSSGPDHGCYEPYLGESALPGVVAVYNTSVQEPNYSRECSASVNVQSWRFCPGPDWPDLEECFGLNFKVTGGQCSETSRQEILLGALAGNGHVWLTESYGIPNSNKTTATCSSYRLSTCASYGSRGSGTGEGNNNRQGPWTPNQEPDGDGAGTTGWGGQGENGGGQSTDGKPQNLPYQSSAFPPLQGAQNSPASTTTATQQKPWTQPIPPTSQHPPNFHDAYVTGGRPTYPIHGGSSPTSGGGNSSNWSGTWGSTVDGTSWWYQQGNTASGSSYAEGSYYIGPGNWGYQYTEW